MVVWLQTIRSVQAASPGRKGRSGSRRNVAALMLCLTACALPCPASSDPVPGPADDASGSAVEAWAIHGQFTYTEQEAGSFSAPYRGPNSLTPRQGRETTDLTLYLGARLWSGAELWINPEIDQGFGLDDTLGVAGFPSGEAYKVGRNRPYFRLQRLFIRDTFSSDERDQHVDAVANQLAGSRSANRWVYTVGKMSVGDIFDVNQYAHDPRADFLNWSVIDGGAFDYAADAWGYTIGAAAERYSGGWTLRAGFYDLSTVPNSEHLQPGFHQFQLIAEVEHRHELAGLAGKLLLTAFESRGHMALLTDAVAHAEQTGGPVDLTAVRHYRSRAGISANFEQSVSSDAGLFARASSAGGNVEAYEFTDIDRSLLGGISLKGSRWQRSEDTLGVAGVINQISAARQRYLAAGGLGILVGDGQLPHPRPEKTWEAYYAWALTRGLTFTFDYQRVTNPAYNADRGPVDVYSLRAHVQF